MTQSIAHPPWILAGLLMLVIGIWLVRWAARNDMTAAISQATAQSAIGALLRRPAKSAKGRDAKEGNATKPVGYAARHAMSQLAGAVGFILIMAGLLAAVLGVYYA